jgi:hypothetical protein
MAFANGRGTIGEKDSLWNNDIFSVPTSEGKTMEIMSAQTSRR